MHGTQQNYIGGTWVPAVAAAPNVNPSNLNDVIADYARAQPVEIDTAVAAATAAFAAYSRSTPQERFEALKRICDEILARKDELGQLLSREEGKTLPEGIGEVVRAGQIFAFFAGEAVRTSGEKIASTRPGIDVEITREPVGVVALITPWNFPMAIPAWKIAPALAYGNCVVFKPADLVPGSAHALAGIIAKSGLPPGVFNLVMGRGSVIVFFSSRRRHTSCSRDWSSDVCSSDLAAVAAAAVSRRLPACMRSRTGRRPPR